MIGQEEMVLSCAIGDLGLITGIFFFTDSSDNKILFPLVNFVISVLGSGFGADKTVACEENKFHHYLSH